MSAGLLPPSGGYIYGTAVASYKFNTYPLKLTAMGQGGEFKIYLPKYFSSKCLYSFGIRHI